MQKGVGGEHPGPCSDHFLPSLFKGTIQINPADSIFNYIDMEAFFDGIQNSPFYTKICCQSSHIKCVYFPVSQIPGQAGDRLLVILKKSGIGVDVPAKTLAED